MRLELIGDGSCFLLEDCLFQDLTISLSGGAINLDAAGGDVTCRTTSFVPHRAAGETNVHVFGGTVNLAGGLTCRF
jgi:hypothetical protein